MSVAPPPSYQPEEAAEEEAAPDAIAPRIGVAEDEAEAAEDEIEAAVAQADVPQTKEVVTADGQEIRPKPYEVYYKYI